MSKYLKEKKEKEKKYKIKKKLKKKSKSFSRLCIEKKKRVLFSIINNRVARCPRSIHVLMINITHKSRSFYNFYSTIRKACFKVTRLDYILLYVKELKA